jgi:hypothetical protein
MKLLLLLFTLLVSTFSFAQDAEDKEVLKLLNSNAGDIVINSPKGIVNGVLVFNKNGVAGVSVKKDVLLGLKPEKVFIQRKVNKGKASARTETLPADMIVDGKYYGQILLRDPKGILGASSMPNIGDKVEIVKYDGKRATGLPLSVNPKKETVLFFFGKIKLGMFAGKANAGGKKGKDKYKIIPSQPYGALVLRQNSAPYISPMTFDSGNATDDVALVKIDNFKTPLDVILNDVKTRDNSGEIYIMWQK